MPCSLLGGFLIYQNKKETTMQSAERFAVLFLFCSSFFSFAYLIPYQHPTLEKVGDGTTSVIVLAGEILDTSIIFLERNIHPTQIVMAYNKALQVICN